MRSSTLARGGMLLLAAAQLSSAHTWIENMMVIAPNGTYVGAPGYARGNVLRTTPGFGDAEMVHLLPPDGDRPVNDLLPTDLMCMSSQTSQTQTDGSPRLQAPAGAAIALRYQENGHVTLPQNQPGKPQNRGTNYLYGTSQPSPDDAFLAIHRQWTPDGSGGDKRGVLLSTQNFDDGQCYEANGGTISNQRAAEFPHPPDPLMGIKLWCQQDIALPSSLKAGSTYTLYWVWDWPTLPGTAGYPDGKQEIYTTCMDIDIVDNYPVESISTTAPQYASGQNVADAAAQAEFSDITNPTAVTNAQTIPFTASATGPASGQAASESVSPTTTDDSFLSVHTTSVTVVPIGVIAGGNDSGMPPFFQSANFAGRRPFPMPSGSGDLTGFPLPYTNGLGPSDFMAISNKQIGQLGGGTATNIQASLPMSTLTEYNTATETVYETVYQTQYTKRTSTLPAVTTLAPIDGSSETSSPTFQISTFSGAAESSCTTITSVPQASPQTDTFPSLITSTAPLPTSTQPPSESNTDTDTDALTTSADIFTDNPTPTIASRAAQPSCSKQHQAFRLRARLPFVKNFLDQEEC